LNAAPTNLQEHFTRSVQNGEENSMQLQSDYLTAYHNLKLTRDSRGVLVAEFHNNGGPFIDRAIDTELSMPSTG
jgi:hypothetical protein